MSGWNPECVQGKHGNCDGQAWDFHDDEPCACQCLCHVKAAPMVPSSVARGFVFLGSVTVLPNPQVRVGQHEA